jgi:hypothetical protein
MIQRSAIWSYWTTGSPSLFVSHPPPKPVHSVLMFDGPRRTVPVFDRIANDSLTVWM